MVAIAFGVAALVTRLAFRFTRSRTQFAAFAAAAVLFAIWRLRALDGRVIAGGALLDALGALAGIAIGRTVDHLSWRRPEA